MKKAVLLCGLISLGLFAEPAMAHSLPDAKTPPSPGKEAAACDALQSLNLPQGRVISAQVVADGKFDEAPLNKLVSGEHSFPAFCRVRGIATPTPRSRIGFEIWLPAASSWSGRLHMVGNGGYSSRIYYAQMIARIKAGDVAVATDTGHSGSDLSFGRDNPEAINDFAYRAVHESVVAAKRVVIRYFGRPQNYAYFSGCSTGGYQGLSEAQRFPADFDGIIAGDPGNNRSKLNLAFLWNYLSNHKPEDDQHPFLDAPTLLFVNKKVVESCDKLDGVADGVISDPRQCHFDVRQLACDTLKSAQCLSRDQIHALEAIYHGPRRRDDGKSIYPGLPFGSEGVEASADDTHPGWSWYLQNPDKPVEPQRVDFFRDWVFHDPNWRWSRFDWSHDLTPVAKFGASFDADNADLSRFEQRGGKLIMFMGWADPVGAPQEAIHYYSRVVAFQHGSDSKVKLDATRKFARLFMVPGMAHCAGGPGATNFSTATRDSTPPVSDASHDMAVALQAWVEEKRAPNELIATHYFANSSQREVAFQRPVCAFPAKAVYTGGDVASATSFACLSEPKRQ